MTRLFSQRLQALPSRSPFVGPEAIERTRKAPFDSRLGANESGFGPSPRALAAMADAALQSWMYGDPDQYELRAAIAERMGIEMGEIVCGPGIDGLLRDLVAASCDAGDTVLTSRGAYPTFAYFASAAGANVETVDYDRDYRQNWPHLAAQAAVIRPKILYLTNPDNPTGSWRTAAEIRDVLAAVPAETIVALDEAYCEFAPSEAILDVNETFPNLLRFRTFSKAYGMAGIRVGFVFGDTDTIAEFQKVRDHFAVSRISQAGALAALSDAEHLHRTVAQARKAVSRLTEIAARHGYEALPSATNFVAIDLRNSADCGRMVTALEERGVFVRRPAARGLDHLLRVSAGPAAALDRFETAFGDILVAEGRPDWR